MDGFGLYCNMYRSMMGMYMILAGLSRRCNVLPLTLGPHGSNMEDIVSTIESILHKGVEVKIYEKTVRLVSFVLAFVGDLPQQQANSQNMRRGC
jgi:hypothetical protein